MNKETILKIGKELLNHISYPNYSGSLAEIRTLIFTYIGKNNPFYEAIDELNMRNTYATDHLVSILDSFLRSVENDLVSNISYERKLKLKVVNDYLAQAEGLLEKPEFHPAVAAFLIGASLEEYLRNWMIEQNITVNEQNHSIDSFADALKKNNLLDKEDHKDIAVWAALRNHAAIGKWDQFENREKIILMLRGVNLFIKKYSG